MDQINIWSNALENHREGRPAGLEDGKIFCWGFDGGAWMILRLLIDLFAYEKRYIF